MKALSTVHSILAIVRDLLLIVVLGAALFFGASVAQGISELGNDPTPAPVFTDPALDPGNYPVEPSPGECVGNEPCATEVPSD